MDKSELIEKISKRSSVDVKTVEAIVDDAIAELVSPVLFPAPGGDVGFINDNNCKNNCKESLLPTEVQR